MCKCRPPTRVRGRISTLAKDLATIRIVHTKSLVVALGIFLGCARGPDKVPRSAPTDHAAPGCHRLVLVPEKGPGIATRNTGTGTLFQVTTEWAPRLGQAFVPLYRLGSDEPSPVVTKLDDFARVMSVTRIGSSFTWTLSLPKNKSEDPIDAVGPVPDTERVDSATSAEPGDLTERKLDDPIGVPIVGLARTVGRYRFLKVSYRCEVNCFEYETWRSTDNGPWEEIEGQFQGYRVDAENACPSSTSTKPSL